MKYRALENFSGALSMHIGEEKELTNKAVIKDLLRAKYIEEVKPEKPNKEKELQSEIEELKKQIAELSKTPEIPAMEVNKDLEPPKDVNPDESK